MAEEEIGKVSDFYAHPVVAAFELTSPLNVGDRIRIRGHTTDIELTIDSIQIDNAPVQAAKAGDSIGVNHLGFQFDTDEEVAQVQQRLDMADIAGQQEADAECCYAHSNKYWTMDTADIPWKNFHIMSDIRTYNGKDMTGQDDICGSHPMDKIKTTLQGCCQ